MQHESSAAVAGFIRISLEHRRAACKNFSEAAAHYMYMRVYWLQVHVYPNVYMYVDWS